MNLYLLHHSWQSQYNYLYSVLVYFLDYKTMLCQLLSYRASKRNDSWILIEKHVKMAVVLFLASILEFVREDSVKPIMVQITISINAQSISPGSVFNFRFLVFNIDILKLSNKLHDKKFPAFSVTQRINTVFKKAHHRILSLSRLIQSTQFISCFLKTISWMSQSSRQHSFSIFRRF